MARMFSEIKPDESIDCRGMVCPMPVLKTKMIMDKLKANQVLEVISTDEGSKRDIQAWANRTGHELLEMKEEDGVFKFYIRKGN